MGPNQTPRDEKSVRGESTTASVSNTSDFTENSTVSVSNTSDFTEDSKERADKAGTDQKRTQREKIILKQE